MLWQCEVFNNLVRQRIDNVDRIAFRIRHIHTIREVLYRCAQHTGAIRRINVVAVEHRRHSRKHAGWSAPGRVAPRQRQPAQSAPTTVFLRNNISLSRVTRRRAITRAKIFSTILSGNVQTSERETEILLGNKQLVAVFFVVAALLGIAFTGGYMVGRGANGKKAASSSPPAGTVASNSESASASAPQGGETHSVPADDGALNPTIPAASVVPQGSEELLGARKKTAVKPESAVAEAAAPVKSDGFVPQGGQEFLQVAAVPHDHALAVAAVLRKKGFPAHAVPKPGDANLYRVIVGPIHDAGELSSTRDSLRKTGFSQVIVQHYQ